MSIRGRLVRLMVMVKRYTVMTSAYSMSIMKGRAIRRDGRSTLSLRKWSVHAAAAIVRLKALAPYALIELVLPGGSVMALLLWLYRRRKNGVGFGQLQLRLPTFLRSPLKA
jgi:hypothetical protein